MRAADLFERGVIPAEIARCVGVAHQVVSEWRKAWRQGGREALRSAGPAGRKPKLNDGQLTEVANALARGAVANGYLTDVWTLPRVAQVIEKHMWPSVERHEDVEGHLLELATGIDISGRGLELISPERRTEVVTA